VLNSDVELDMTGIHFLKYVENGEIVSPPGVTPRSRNNVIIIIIIT